MCKKRQVTSNVQHVTKYNAEVMAADGGKQLF
jgi:hypothetical protein